MSMVCSVVDNSWRAVRGPCCKCVSKSWFFTRRTDITDAGKRTETCASIKEPGGQQTLGSAVCQHQTLPCPAHTSGCWETNLAEMAAGSLWWSVDVVCKCCDSPSHSMLSSSQAPWWMICHSQLLDQDGEMQMLSSPGVWDTLCVVDSCLTAQKYRNFFSRVNLSPATVRQGCGPTIRTTGCRWDAQRSLRGAVVLFLWGTVLLARLQGAMPAFINLLCCRMLLEGPHVDRRHGRSFLLLSKAVLSTLTQGW